MPPETPRRYTFSSLCSLSKKVSSQKSGRKIRKATVFVAEGWKFKVYEKVIKNKHRPQNDVIKEIVAGASSKGYENVTASFIQQMYRKLKIGRAHV